MPEEVMRAFFIVVGALVAACSNTTTGSDAGGSDATVEGSGGDGGDEASAPCSPACGMGKTCCNGACVNTDNDPYNCGGCGTKCVGQKPYCDGTCKALPTCMADGGMCPGGAGGGGPCCGDACCQIYEICCKIGTTPKCFAPAMGQLTCPP